MTLDDRIGQLVRDAIEPMLHQLEQRLVERLDGLVQPPVTKFTPDLLTTRDLASYLRVSPRTVQRRAAAGELPPPISVSSRRARWRRCDIDEWLDRGGMSP